MSLPVNTEGEEATRADQPSLTAPPEVLRLPGLTTFVEGVVAKMIRLLSDKGNSGVICRRRRDMERGYIAWWYSSDRTRLIALDVVDACVDYLIHDLPKRNIVPQVFCNILKREAKNWWQLDPFPAVHTRKNVNGAPPGRSGAEEELKGLQMEVHQLRAEVRELRRELLRMIEPMGQTKQQVQGEELRTASDTSRSSPGFPAAAARLRNLLSKMACEVTARLSVLPEITNAMKKQRFWEQVGSSARGEDVRTSQSSA